MKNIWLATLLFFYCPLKVQAQGSDKTVFTASVFVQDSALVTIASAGDTTPAERITFNRYFRLLGSNLKRQFTAPFRASGKDWLHVGSFAVITGALAFTDRPIQEAALRLRNRSSAVKNVSGFVTEFGGLYEGVTLAVLGTYGTVFKKERMVNTTLLATQAYITGAAVGTFVKMITARQRPNYFGSDTITARSTFHGPFGAYRGNTYNSAFPSGHATVAFAAATVFAEQYRDKPLVPVIAYTAASLISVSRITENKHWTTDVVVGAALGYFSGKKVVGNYRRQVAGNWIRRSRNTLTFSVQYLNGQLLPAMVYRFR